MTPVATGAIARRVETVRAAIAAAAERSGRAPDSVLLVAVSKTVAPALLREAWEAGVSTFGENYVQEALAKAPHLPATARWHFIGHLQSNKAKQALDLFSVVESLDRPSVGDALEKAARARGARLGVLLQVNIGAEETKGGAPAEGAAALLRRAAEWPSLAVRGLMAIPPYRDDPEEVRPYFRALRELRDRLEAEHPGLRLPDLSMGMSSDFTVAIEEGATIVRVGTALFGARPYPVQH